MRNPIRSRQLAAIARPFVVVENDLLIEFGEIAGHGADECQASLPEWQLSSVAFGGLGPLKF